MLASGVSLTGVFGDVVFLAITVAFFGLAWLLVRACERIGGREEVLVEHRGDPSERDGRAVRAGSSAALAGGPAMTFDNVVALILSLALVAYLVARAVVPEKF